MIKAKKLNSTFAFIFFLTASIPVHAEEITADDFFGLVEAVSKRTETVAETPGIVTVITAQEMEELGIRTIEEALTFVPGFEVDYRPRRNTVYTRGVVESALVLIDGVSIVSPIDGEVFLDEAFSLGTVDRIEVIRGPGGVLWGSTAFLGVINIVTKKPESADGKMTVASEFGSYDAKKVSLTYDKKYKPFSLFAHVSELRTQDYRVGNRELWSPLTGRWNDGFTNDHRMEDNFREMFLKFVYQDFTLTTRFADETDYYQITDRGLGIYKNFDLVEKDPIKEFLRLEYNRKFEPGNVMARVWTVNRESYLEGAYVVSSNPSGNVHWIFDTWKTWKRGAEAEFTTDKLLPRNTTLFGASYIQNYGTSIYTWDEITNIGDTSSGDVITPNWFYGNYPLAEDGFGIIRPQLAVNAGPGERITSLYMTDSYNIVDPLTISGGYRYDYNTAYNDINHFNGSAVYQFIQNHYLKYIYAEGFRPADWEQKTSAFVGGNDIEPEQSKSHEVQYNAQIGKGISYYVNYARTNVDKLVTLRLIAPGVSRYANSGEMKIDSAEAGGKFGLPWDKGYTFANYNYKCVTDETTGDVPYIANHIFNIGAYIKLPFSFATTVTTHYEGEKKMMLLPEGTKATATNAANAARVLRKIDPFAVVNWGLHYKFKNFKTSLFVYNVFDLEYNSPPFPGFNIVSIPNPRRNFLLKASYDF